MTDLPTLASLLERVEKAEGPDRELDAAIWRVLCWSNRDTIIPRDALLTASLDAALALVEEKLPGCNGLLMFGEPHRNPIMRLAPLYPDGRHPVEAGGATLPLAVLSALLRALIAQKETADV
jgi:hypothetical protein